MEAVLKAVAIQGNYNKNIRMDLVTLIVSVGREHYPFVDIKSVGTAL